MHGSANPVIGSAPAKVAGHSIVDVIVCRVGNFAEEGGGGHHLTGMTISALRCLQFEPGFLYRVTEIARQALNGCHRMTMNTRNRCDTRSNRCSIQMNGASTAPRNAATVFSSR